MTRTRALPATLAVAVGGTAGTLVRAGLAQAWPHAPGTIPTATLAVNLTGALCLGLLLGRLTLSPDAGWRRTVRLGVGTGFMGGLTTYSTFMVEVAQLTSAADGASTLGEAGGATLNTALAYWAGSVVGGVMLAAAGLWIAQALPSPRTPPQAAAAKDHQ